MAGSSGNELTTWASSAEYHQDKGDYNDNVIVPRSILVDTADAIRIKKYGTATVKSDVDVFGDTFISSTVGSPGIRPEYFATEIGNLEVGGGYTPTTADLTFTGNASSLFASNKWSWVLNQYSDKIQFNNISGASELFRDATAITDLSGITINFNPTNNGSTANGQRVSSLIYGCKNCIKPPHITGRISNDFSNLAYNCNYLQEPFDFSNVSFIFYNYALLDLRSMYVDCHRLNKSLDFSFLPNEVATVYTTSSITYSGIINQAFCVPVVLNLPVVHHTNSTTILTNNMFNSTVWSATRLSRFTFQLNANNQPYTAYWKNQSLDFSNDVGYYNGNTNWVLTALKEGTGEDEPVVDATTYNQMKNNPNWWSASLAYSRYNHTSAVETINTLPDTSAVANSGNTISFKAGSGNSTDGGGIDDLTSAEIAVATAKGWTVSIV